MQKRKLLGALQRDQVTPQQVIEQIPEGPGFGPIDESVIDLAGENTLGLARASQANTWKIQGNGPRGIS